MNITVITSEGCNNCSHVLSQLEELRGEFTDMNVHKINIGSDEGQKLVATHGILSSPGVLIDGKLAFYGHKSTEEIRAILSHHSS